MGRPGRKDRAMTDSEATLTIADGLTLYAKGPADTLEAVHLPADLLADIERSLAVLRGLDVPKARGLGLVMSTSLYWYWDSRGDLFATRYAPGNVGVGKADLRDADIHINVNDGFTVSNVEDDEESGTMFWKDLERLRWEAGGEGA